MKEERKEIDRLMKLGADELYVLIGNRLIGLGAMPRPKKEVGKIGKLWLENRKSKLVDALCQNERIKALIAKGNEKLKNRIVLVAVVADCLSAMITSVSPITVSVLLVREGLEALCEKHNSNDQKLGS